MKVPFESKRARLELTLEARQQVEDLAHSRTEPAQRVARARMMLAYADGQTISAIARELGTNRPRVETCVAKALELGALAALADLAGRGRPATITPEARAWVVSLACQKPKELNYSYELWTTDLLARHVRKHCLAAGHPSLAKLGRGTVSKILNKGGVHPHKIQYYLERRDPDFEEKMAQILCVYRDVELLRKQQAGDGKMVAILSYDEKPGIQAISNTAPDLPPVPGRHPSVGRDYEYVRHGTVSLMAGIDLLSGHVHGIVVDRHRSREFIQFLRVLDDFYPPQVKLRIIMDNHSAHISKETRGFLATKPNRYEFIFTPKHGSWLNLVESFFGKMARTMLRGIRVSSKDELKRRIKQFLAEQNSAPVVFQWKYGLDSVSVV